MNKWINCLALGTIGLVLLAATVPDLLLFPRTLLFGWIHALRRIASMIVASPVAVAWAGLTVVLIVAGTHGFGLWLWRRLWPEVVAEDGTKTSAQWRWRWTVTLHAALAIALFAAMSVVGVAHQTGWLIAAREPIYVPRYWSSPHPHRMQMRSLAGAIEFLGAEQRWDADAIRKHVWSCLRGEADLQEKMHTVFLKDAGGRLVRALVFPRNPKTFAQTGVGIVEPDAKYRTEPAVALTNLLQALPSAAQTAATTP